MMTVEQHLAIMELYEALKSVDGYASIDITTYPPSHFLPEENRFSVSIRLGDSRLTFVGKGVTLYDAAMEVRNTILANETVAQHVREAEFVITSGR